MDKHRLKDAGRDAILWHVALEIAGGLRTGKQTIELRSEEDMEFWRVLGEQMERKVEGGAQTAARTERTEKKMTADEAKESLSQRYGIESAFVRVAQLSRILGIATPTIYTAMREGRFFLPHRMLCSMPAVRLDDLAEWYISQEQPSPKLRRQADEKAMQATEKAPQGDDSREQIIARVLARVRSEHAVGGGGSKASQTLASGAQGTKRRARAR